MGGGRDGGKLGEKVHRLWVGGGREKRISHVQASGNSMNSGRANFNVNGTN